MDSDFFTYGAGRVLFSDAKAKDRFHSCGLDILGHVLADIDFRTCTLPEFATLCVAAGCDYLQRVYYMTWPRLSELRRELICSARFPFIFVCVQTHIGRGNQYVV